MNTWFTVKVKYTKQMEDGRLKRVTEPYLVDSVSFTEAEARIYDEIGTKNALGEMVITGISKTDFADVFYYDDSGDWYKCKLTYVSIDADEGKEKKVTSNFLITASNVKEAYERIHESLSDMTVSFEVPSIMLTPIVEVLPYDPDLDVELDRKPLEEYQAAMESEEDIEEDTQEEDFVEEEEIVDEEESSNVVFKDETEM